MSPHNRPQFLDLAESPAGIGAVMRERPTNYLMLMSFAQEILREYCCGSHTAFAASLGATAADVQMINSEDISDHRMSALLAYVRKLTLAPSTISDTDKQPVHAAGFSEDQLKDAIAVCAAFNLFNRIVEGHGVAPQESYDQDAKMINTHGYDRRR